MLKDFTNSLVGLKAEVGMVTSEFRDFCENRRSPYRSKISMRIQQCRPFFMSTSISQSDFEVLAQILESLVTIFCSYETRCKIMLRRARMMILDVNRIRILKRIQIFTRKFQNAAHWLSKSGKHVDAQSRHRKCPFWSVF